MVIESGKVVSISYTLVNQDNRLIEQRTPDDPIHFIVGKKQILQSLEKELIGLSFGFKGRFEFPPEKAHGLYAKNLIFEMTLDQFPKDIEVKVGMKFHSEDKNGESIPLHVIAIEQEKILVDGNHPLAGETLVFDINVLDVRDAGKEELSRGQVLIDTEPETKSIH